MRSGSFIITLLVLSNLFLLYRLMDHPGDPAVHTSPQTAATQPASDSEPTTVSTTTEAADADVDADADNIDFGAIVASIDGTAVRQYELLPYLYDVMSDERIAAMENLRDIGEAEWHSAVEQMALDLTIGDLAEQAGLLQQAELQATIRYSRRQLIRRAYLKQVASRQVDDSQLKQHYDALAKRLQNKSEYRIAHILLANRKEADIIYRALSEQKRGFDELAKLFSLDDATAYRGGDLGYQLTERLDPDFSRHITALEPDRFSKPFRTELGWHIAKVTDKRPARLLPYAQAAPRLRTKLEQQYRDAQARALLQQSEIRLFVVQD